MEGLFAAMELACRCISRRLFYSVMVTMIALGHIMAGNRASMYVDYGW